MTQPLQYPIAHDRLRSHFKRLPFSIDATVRCTIQNSGGERFHDLSQNNECAGPASLRNGLLVGKSLFYMKAMKMYSGTIPKDQRFAFDITPDLDTQTDTEGYKWLIDIMNTFAPTSVNLGILEWFDDEEICAIAEFAFLDRGSAMAFKLKYL